VNCHGLNAKDEVSDDEKSKPKEELLLSNVKVLVERVNSSRRTHVSMSKWVWIRIRVFWFSLSKTGRTWWDDVINTANSKTRGNRSVTRSPDSGNFRTRSLKRLKVVFYSFAFAHDSLTKHCLCQRTRSFSRRSAL